MTRDSAVTSRKELQGVIVSQTGQSAISHQHIASDGAHLFPEGNPVQRPQVAPIAVATPQGVPDSLPFILFGLHVIPRVPDH